MAALFITEQWFKDNTPIVGSVDVTEILPFIRQAQDMYIQDVLGSKFMASLETKIAANTLSSDETTLLLLVRPALAHHALWLMLPTLWIKIRSKGVMKGDDADSKSVDRSDLNLLMERAKSTAEFYTQRLQDYLCKNGRLFSDYVSPENPVTPNAYQGFTCDLYLENLEGYGGRPGDFNWADLEFYKRYIRNA